MRPTIVVVLALAWLAPLRAAEVKSPAPAVLSAALAEQKRDELRQTFAPLGKVGTLPAEYRPVLRMAMKNPDERIRLYAALGLSATGLHDEAVIQEILRALAVEKHTYLMEDDLIAELALAAQGARAMPVVLAALKHESAHVRFHALRAVEAIGPAARDALPEVMRWIDAPDASLLRQAVMAKWSIDGDDRFVVATFVPLLSSKRERQCAGAAQCLAKLGPGAKEAVPALIAAMKEHKDYAVIEALADLCPHFKEQILAAFREALDDPKLAERAAGTLLHCDGPKDYLLPHLARMMNREGDVAVERHELARVLGTCGPAAAPAIPGLIRTLASPSGQTRINAAEALGLIGPAAKEALPALEKLKEDREVVAYAVQAIGRIETK